MKERPILFSAPMVRALLDGTKTQTRRVVKRIPWLPGVNQNFSQARAFDNAGEWRIAGSEEMTATFRCPYGRPGDRLWVRETWSVDPCPVMPFTGPCSPDGGEVMYRATDGWNGPWAPSIHMFRWASRITLEITDVRVQRLQDISGSDAVAEGVQAQLPGSGVSQSHFADLWQSINGPASWVSNPWVWAVSFRRMDHDRG